MDSFALLVGVLLLVFLWNATDLLNLDGQIVSIYLVVMTSVKVLFPLLLCTCSEGTKALPHVHDNNRGSQLFKPRFLQGSSLSHCTMFKFTFFPKLDRGKLYSEYFQCTDHLG